MLAIIVFLGCLVSLSSLSTPSYAAVFNITSGDVAGLINAINGANANGEENTINLAPGTYELTSADNQVAAPGDANGLPVITGVITIRGSGADTTEIGRKPTSTLFRIFDIASGGVLNLSLLSLVGGMLETADGAAIRNQGTLNIDQSIIANNFTLRSQSGGGIQNSGTATVTKTTLRGNIAGFGAAISNDGTFLLSDSTVSDNHALGFGGGMDTDGAMLVFNTTVANNIGRFGSSAIRAAGTLRLLNSTIVGNEVLNDLDPADSGAVAGFVAEMQNTILALSEFGPSMFFDCTGQIHSSGNNIVGDPGRCTIDFQPTDLTGDPGVGAFVDSGAPGNGRVPLLATSRLINAGNDAACPPTDQLDMPRRRSCDIGAVEFYPVVNDLIALSSLTTDFDPTPAANAPAGTFHITAEFTNSSGQTIVHPFTEVIQLTDNDVLVNANGGSGGVGARVNFPNFDTPLEPGATQTLDFSIGLQTRDQFNFLVNVLGDAQASE
jgi:hypothetical protein